jgi:hypothetical protein
MAAGPACGCLVRSRGDQEYPPPLWVLRRMFLGHVELIIRYPDLAKVVFSDHIRHQYPALHEQFHALHRRYEREVTTLLEDAVRRSDLPSATDVPAAATLFFCTIQGLGFQSAIARYRRTRVWDNATRLFALSVSAIGARQTALDGSMDRRPPGASGSCARHECAGIRLAGEVKDDSCRSQLGSDARKLHPGGSMRCAFATSLCLPAAHAMIGSRPVTGSTVMDLCVPKIRF